MQKQPSYDMGKLMKQFWFQSTLFEIEPGEDAQTNPRIYGKQFAAWLTDKLTRNGYRMIECFPEDRGWCIMVLRDPFRLFVACANVADYDTAEEGDPPPPKDAIVWSCFAAVEKPFFKRLFHKIDPAPEMDRLETTIERILEQEPAIRLVEEV